jgi:3-hydroxyisobutyrate dehydrogenase-like beta-hydroxyacid dehydrogenase
MHVTFIGLGLMGTPMATRLLEAGYDLTVHSRRRESGADLAERGARWADTAQAAAAQADVVITMLPDGAAVESVLADALTGPAPAGGQVVVDMSTIGPLATDTVHRLVTAQGRSLVDAPVSGGPPGATAGTLAIMAGGDSADFARVEPILAHLGRPHLLGPVGSGQKTKLVNQVLIGGIMGGLAEAFALASSQGLDLDATFQVASGGMAASNLLAWAWPRLIDGDLSPAFKISHMVKDLDLALGAAAHEGLDLAATKSVVAGYQRAGAAVGNDKGTQALVHGVMRSTDRSENT